MAVAGGLRLVNKSSRLDLRRKKAAGEPLPPSSELTGRSFARALNLRARGIACFIVTQTNRLRQNRNSNEGDDSCFNSDLFR